MNKYLSRLFYLFLITITIMRPCRINAQPSLEESAKEPIKYIGSEQTDKYFYHGGLRYVIGTHHYQTFRANQVIPVFIRKICPVPIIK